MEQISVDHSAVQELLDQGRLKPQEAASHAERHVITRAVGAGSKAEPDYWLLPVSAGERLLICSDGLSREVTFDLLQRVLLDETSPGAAATRLVHEALLHGGSDNVSVIVVDAVRVLEALDDDFSTVTSATAGLEVDTMPRSALRELSGGDQ